MKITSKIAVVAAILLVGVATACNDKNKGNGVKDDGINPKQIVTLADIKDATMADSLAYLLGESMAAKYWEGADNNPDLAGAENAKLFAEGFEAGVKDVQERRVYALAYSSAAAVMADVEVLKNQYKININTDRLCAGFKVLMKDKNAVDATRMQAITQYLQSQLQSPDKMDKSAVDSLSYSMGLAAAGTYWQMCKSDTTLAGSERNKDFTEGFVAGIKDMKSKLAYVVGYGGACEICEQIRAINEEADLNLSINRMCQGFNYGMQSKDAINRMSMRREMMEIETRVNETVAAKANAAAPVQGGAAQTATAQPAQAQQNTAVPAQDPLKMAADKQGANLTTKSGIRYKVIKQGSGASPVNGDIVTISAAFKDVNGNILQTTKSDQGEYMSFQLSPEAVPYRAFAEIIQTMKPGEHAIFFVPMSATEGKSGDHILDIKLTNTSKQ